MKPEEYLDRLIERREHGKEPLVVANDEIAASLAAAQALAQLQQIDIPPEFAQKLELSIRTRARNLARQNDRIIPTTQPLSIPRSPRPRRPQLRRAWIAALGIAAAMLLALVGILTVSAHSLPGDALYGLKQAEYQFTLNFTGNPQDRVNVQISQLHNTLIDLNTVANNGRGDDAIKLALNIVADKTNSIRGTVAALPAGTERETAQRDLDSILGEEDQTLRQLLNHADWPVRLAFTRQLGALGDPVPTVTSVIVLSKSNGTLLITLTGTHFVPNAQLVIDGQPGGTVIQNTQGQLVAVISKSTGLHGAHEIGILNPDGTAAQMTYGKDTDNDQENDDNARYGTPEPTRDSKNNSDD